MPAFSLDIATEMKAQLGEFRAAARDMEREFNDAQKRIQRDIRAGLNAKPEDVERAQHAEERRSYYMGRAKSNERGEEFNQYEKSAGRYSARISEDHDDARIENSKRSLDRIADEVADSRNGRLQSVADLLNTHNPHGRLRSIFSGHIGASHFEQLGNSISENSGDDGMLKKFGQTLSQNAMAAAPMAFIAAAATREVMQLAEESAKNGENAAQINLGIASKNFDVAHARKYDPSTQTTEYLKARSAQLERAAQDVAATQPTFGWADAAMLASPLTAGMTVAKFMSSMIDNGSHEKEMAKGAQTLADLYKPGSAMGAVKGGRLDWKNYMDSAAVNRHFELERTWIPLPGFAVGVGGGGDENILSYLKSQTIDRVTGERERQREKYAQDLAVRRVQGLAAELEKQEVEYQADPHNRLNDRERDHHSRLVEEAAIKHFQNWNPI